MDRDLGGVVIEVHCCPACGKVEARPASWSARYDCGSAPCWAPPSCS